VKKPLFGLLLGLLVLFGLLVVIAILATTSSPLVAHDKSIAPGALTQAKRLFRLNDPRQFQAGELRQVAIPVSLLDAGSNFLIAHLAGGRGEVSLDTTMAELRLSVPLSLLAGPRYLNLRLGLPAGDGPPHLTNATVGKLPLPPALVDWAIDKAADRSGHGQEWRLARAAIRKLAFEPERNRVVVGFVWAPEILEQLRLSAFPPEELTALRDAHAALAHLLDARANRPAGSVIELLVPLMTLPGDDRQLRQRTALGVLAAYLAGRSIASVVPEARNWPALRPTEPTLLARHDTAQHFIVSAAVTAWANEPVAVALGTEKELADARQGSGFSFADLAADRAGTRFGELVAKHPERVDSALDAGLAEVDIVPPLTNLPEFLHQPEFQRRFGGPGQPAYQAMTDEIERRLGSLPLYR
jgi:hypothetical protein